MTYTIEKFASESEWLAARRSGIGASEAPALLNLSPFSSRYSIWAEKVGLCESGMDPNDDLLVFGRLFEKPTIGFYEHLSGRTVIEWDKIVLCRSVESPWLICTPDGAQYADFRPDPGLLEIKTRNQFSRELWKDGRAPWYYQGQLQYQLLVTGLLWGTIACLTGTGTVVWRDYERDDEWCETMRSAASEFWKLVVAKKEPEIDGAEATADALHRVHRVEDKGESVGLPLEADQWADDLHHGQELLEEAEGVVGEAKNKLINAIGSATYGRTPRGKKFSYKSQSRGGGQPFRVLRESR